MKRNSRIFILVLLALVMAASTYAFAAANTVPTSSAGDGQGAISGYTISNIHYTLDAANPALLSSVAFTVTPAAGASAPATVTVQFAAGGAWSTCTNTAGTSWSCPVTGITALAAENLRVVAAQ